MTRLSWWRAVLRQRPSDIFVYGVRGEGSVRTGRLDTTDGGSGPGLPAPLTECTTPVHCTVHLSVHTLYTPLYTHVARSRQHLAPYPTCDHHPGQHHHRANITTLPQPSPPYRPSHFNSSGCASPSSLTNREREREFLL